MPPEPLSPLANAHLDGADGWIGLGVSLLILICLLFAYYALLALHRRRIQRRTGFDRPIQRTHPETRGVR